MGLRPQRVGIKQFEQIDQMSTEELLTFGPQHTVT